MCGGGSNYLTDTAGVTVPGHRDSTGIIIKIWQHEWSAVLPCGLRPKLTFVTSSLAFFVLMQPYFDKIVSASVALRVVLSVRPRAVSAFIPPSLPQAVLIKAFGVSESTDGD